MISCPSHPMNAKNLVSIKAVAAEHVGAVDAGPRQEVECECVEQLLRGSPAGTTLVKLIHP